MRNKRKGELKKFLLKFFNSETHRNIVRKAASEAAEDQKELLRKAVGIRKEN